MINGPCCGTDLRLVPRIGKSELSQWVAAAGSGLSGPQRKGTYAQGNLWFNLVQANCGKSRLIQGASRKWSLLLLRRFATQNQPGDLVSQDAVSWLDQSFLDVLNAFLRECFVDFRPPLPEYYVATLKLITYWADLLAENDSPTGSPGQWIYVRKQKTEERITNNNYWHHVIIITRQRQGSV